MKNFVLSSIGAALLFVSCQPNEKAEELVIEEAPWTVELIDEIVKPAEERSKKIECKLVDWIVKDDSHVPSDLRELVETPEFIHEAEYCDLGDGIIKYVYNESYHEYYGVNEFFVKDGKLMYILQSMNSEGYLMTRKFFYNQKGELLKGLNTDFLEDDHITVKADYKEKYEKLIKENSEEALVQFKMIQAKFI